MWSNQETIGDQNVRATAKIHESLISGSIWWLKLRIKNIAACLSVRWVLFSFFNLASSYNLTVHPRKIVNQKELLGKSQSKVRQKTEIHANTEPVLRILISQSKVRQNYYKFYCKFWACTTNSYLDFIVRQNNYKFHSKFWACAKNSYLCSKVRNKYYKFYRKCKIFLMAIYMIFKYGKQFHFAPSSNYIFAKIYIFVIFFFKIFNHRNFSGACGT